MSVPGRSASAGWLVGAAVLVGLIGWVLNDNGTAALTTIAARRDPVAVAHGAARVRGPDVAGSGHARGGGRPDRGASSRQTSGLPFLDRARCWRCWARFPSASWSDCPSARTRGVSLAVATLGLAVAIQALVFTTTRSPGGRPGSRSRTRVVHGSSASTSTASSTSTGSRTWSWLRVGAGGAGGQSPAQRVGTADDRGPRQRASRRRAGHQRRHDEAVGLRDRRGDHGPGRGAWPSTARRRRSSRTPRSWTT